MINKTLLAVSFLALPFMMAYHAALPTSGSAPTLTGAQWLNTQRPIDLSSRSGKVTIVHFWTFGCINCRNNLPTYSKWQKQFAKDGVEIIGVHTPETVYERNLNHVSDFLRKNGITYPVLYDGDEKNWKAWGVDAWPTVFLIDKKGIIREKWVGELDYDNAGGTAKLTSEIQALLRE